MNATPIDQLRLTTFQPLVNEVFQVELGDQGRVELVLVEACALPTPAHPNPQIKVPQQEIFSLTFHGPEDRFLPQATYQFSQEKLGSTHLFLVPTARLAGHFEYQVLFNRLIKAS